MVDVEKMIAEVQKYPVLYDQYHERYRNFDYKEKVWKTITANLKIEGEVEECKKKWSSVRDQFRRTLQKRNSQAGRTAIRKHRYKYEDVLSFLVPHLSDREGRPALCAQDEEATNDGSLENVSEDTTHQHEDDDPKIKYEDGEFLNEKHSTEQIKIIDTQNEISTNTSKFAKPKVLKRKLPQPEEIPHNSPYWAYKVAENEHKQKAVDAFLGGIAPSLTSLNPYLLNEAKAKIFAVVQDMELRQLQINSNGRGHLLANYGTNSPPPSESSVSDALSDCSR